MLGTLLVQGLTLRPLLELLRLPKGDTVELEVGMAREEALRAALSEIEGDDTPSAARLGQEYRSALDRARTGADPRDRADNVLRRRMVIAGRHAIEALRASSAIGDGAYRRVEEELDLMELSAQPTDSGD